METLSKALTNEVRQHATNSARVLFVTKHDWRTGNTLARNVDMTFLGIVHTEDTAMLARKGNTNNWRSQPINFLYDTIKRQGYRRETDAFQSQKYSVVVFVPPTTTSEPDGEYKNGILRGLAMLYSCLRPGGYIYFVIDLTSKHHDRKCSDALASKLRDILPNGSKNPLLRTCVQQIALGEHHEYPKRKKWRILTHTWLSTMCDTTTLTLVDSKRVACNRPHYLRKWFNLTATDREELSARTIVTLQK